MIWAGRAPLFFLSFSSFLSPRGPAHLSFFPARPAHFFSCSSLLVSVLAAGVTTKSRSTEDGTVQGTRTGRASRERPGSGTLALKRGEGSRESKSESESESERREWEAGREQNKRRAEIGWATLGHFHANRRRMLGATEPAASPSTALDFSGGLWERQRGKPRVLNGQ